jgi:hypothetical protein
VVLVRQGGKVGLLQLEPKMLRSGGPSNKYQADLLNRFQRKLTAVVGNLVDRIMACDGETGIWMKRDRCLEMKDKHLDTI